MEENVSILYAFTLIIGLVGGTVFTVGYMEKDSASLLLQAEEQKIHDVNTILASFNITDQNRTLSIEFLNWHSEVISRGTLKEFVGLSMFLVGAVIAAYGFHKWS